jgi:hypothetical protein
VADRRPRAAAAARDRCRLIRCCDPCSRSSWARSRRSRRRSAAACCDWRAPTATRTAPPDTPRSRATKAPRRRWAWTI